MAYTLNNFKASLASRIEEAGTATSIASEKAAELTGVGTRSAVKGIKSATNGVRRALPVSTRRFEGLVSQVNMDLDNVNREAFKARLVAELVADAMGVNLPSEEDLDGFYDAEQKKDETEKKREAARKEVEEQATKTKKKEEMKEKLQEKKEDIKGMVANVFNGKKEEELQLEDILNLLIDIPEQAKEALVEETKEEKKKGRKRRLTVHAEPLIEE